jgi:hypothetical protein
MERMIVIRRLAACAASWLAPFVLTGAVGAAEPASWRRLEVPATVSVREDVATVPAGWRAMSDDRPHVLACATFFDGPPEKQGSLVFEHESKRKDRIVRTWHFYPDGKSSAWLQLCYSATTVVLARPLPLGTMECRVEFDKAMTVDGYEQIKSIECK